jgi:hypothetical protein
MEKLEDNHENYDEADKDEGIEIFAESQIFRDQVGQLGKDGERKNGAPDEKRHQELEKSLALFILEKFSSRTGHEKEGD